MIILRKRGEVLILPFVKDSSLSLLLAAIMGAALWPLYHFPYFAGAPKLITIPAGLILGPALYFGLGYALKTQNLTPLLDAAVKIKAKFRRGRKKAG
jgi:hypothetical protein